MRWQSEKTDRYPCTINVDLSLDRLCWRPRLVCSSVFPQRVQVQGTRQMWVRDGDPPYHIIGRSSSYWLALVASESVGQALLVITQ